MKTGDCSEETISSAISVLKRGGVIAFPTETYYGLGVDPFNISALEKLYKIKKRDATKPVLVLVEDIEQAEKLAAKPVPNSFYRLAELFWPGALTLVCDKGEKVPLELTGNSNTIGMRQSSHPVAQNLVQSFCNPITATSANISGKSPAITAEEVLSSFPGEVDLVIDGGTSRGTLASTLVKCHDDGIECLREGVISFIDIITKFNSL